VKIAILIGALLAATFSTAILTFDARRVAIGPLSRPRRVRRAATKR
jgi:hypothetical protein